MSRIGKQPITVPETVTVTIDGSKVSVDGPKGRLERVINAEISVALDDGALVLTRPSDEARHKALHGLTRSLLANMVEGVTDGFERKMELIGTGYRAEQEGSTLVLHVGFSHSVNVEPPTGIEFAVEDRGKLLTVSGIDKETVGQVAVNIRNLRPPEPYKGKGIRYQGEHVTLKAGKAGKAKG